MVICTIAVAVVMKRIRELTEGEMDNIGECCLVINVWIRDSIDNFQVLDLDNRIDDGATHLY